MVIQSREARDGHGAQWDRVAMTGKNSLPQTPHRTQSLHNFYEFLLFYQFIWKTPTVFLLEAVTALTSIQWVP